MKSAEQQASLMRQAVKKLQEQLSQRSTKVTELEMQIEKLMTSSSSSSSEGPSGGDNDSNKEGSLASVPSASEQRLISHLKGQLADARRSEDLLTAELDAMRQTAASDDEGLSRAQAELRAKDGEIEEQRLRFEELQLRYTMVEGRSAELERSLTAQQAEMEEARSRDAASAASAASLEMDGLEATVGGLREQLRTERAARARAEEDVSREKAART